MTALASAGMEPVQPDSPTPFEPSRFKVVRTSRVLLVRRGIPVKMSFAADAFFDFDKSVLKAEGKAKLKDLVAKIQNISLEVVIAVGHTDSVGTDAYNQKLSERRAEAVKAFLVSLGVPKNRIYTEGKGESAPAADNQTAAGRAKNRRVEVEVVGTK